MKPLRLLSLLPCKPKLYSALALILLGGSLVKSPSADFETIVHFGAITGSDHPRQPEALLMQHSDGLIYGTTTGGGASSVGSIFRLTADDTFERLADFNGINGQRCTAALTEGIDGGLFGVCDEGGTNSYGTFFVYRNGQGLSRLLEFNSTTLTHPARALARDENGNFVGIARLGGVSGYGGTFRVTPTGGYTLLNNFDGLSSGREVYGLVRNLSDNLYYAAAFRGGYYLGQPDPGGWGTIFRINGDHSATVIRFLTGSGDSAPGGPADGARPDGPPFVGTDGDLYGTTTMGGTGDGGVLYRCKLDGTYSILHTFNPGDATPDGHQPTGTPTEGLDGFIYGICQRGGETGDGTLWRVRKDGSDFEILHHFTGNGANASGSSPRAGLMRAADGRIYGVTASGGANNEGTIFRYQPALEPVLTTGAATNKTASTATLNGTVTPNDVAVDVSIEYGTAADALTNSVAAKLANDAPATGLTGTTAIAVHADVTANLGPNPDGSAKTYFFRVKATAVGGTTFPGEVVQFTIQNSAPVPKAGAAFFTSGSIAVPVGGLAMDADGDALTIVGTPAQGAGEILLGTVSPAQDGRSFTFKPNAQFPNAQDGVTLNYTVSDGRAVPGPVAGSVKIYSFSLFEGAYVGTIKTDEGGVDGTGRLGLNIMATGVVTYSFTWQGRDYSGKSQIGPDGALPPLSEFKVGDSGPTLSLSLTLQPDPVSRLLDGTLTDGEDGKVATARLLGTVRGSDTGADLPEPGTFTGYIEPLVVTSAAAEAGPEAGLTLLPRGTGFTRFTTLNRRGRPARIVGRMPDDQPWSNGVKGVTRSQRDAGNPFYQILNDILYGRVSNGSRGVIEGQARFERSANRNGFESRLNWERTAGVGDRFAQGFRTVRPGLAGFIATLEAIKYNRPFPFPAGIVDNTNTVNAQIDFRAGDLDSDLARDLKLRRTGRGPIRVQVGPGEPAGKQPKDLKLKINVNAGTFSGSFIHPKHEPLTKPPRTTFTGVFTTPAVSADPGDGQGVFNGPDADSTTGSITIQGK